MSPFRTRLAAQALSQGGLIAYPTESVWGLGCDPANPSAVNRLLALKSRPAQKGLILVAASIDQFADYLAGLDETLLQRLDASWPGPVTWLVPDNGFAPFWIKGEHNSVALRVSAHPVVAQLCREFGGPIVSTSANRTGQQPIQRSWQLAKHFGRQINYCLQAPLGSAANPTEIRDLMTESVIRVSQK